MNATLRTILAIFFLIIILLMMATAFQAFMSGETLYGGFMNAASRMLGVENIENVGINIVSLFITLLAASAIYYLLGYILEIFVNINVGEVFFMDRIKRLRNHYIICGAGRVGFNVAQRLREMKKKFVIIEKDDDVAEEMKGRYGFLVLNSDATDDYNLDKAGISRAKGIICALGKSEDNFFLVITAKQMNPELKVISRAETLNIASKMTIAGADDAVTPEVLSGRQMAEKIVKL